jgi:hypothetical protein
MEVLKDETGNGLDLDPCKRCKANGEGEKVCPCEIHSGEIHRIGHRIVRFACEEKPS